MSKKLSDMGGTMQRAGRTMTTRVTAPLVGLAGASVYASSNFDDSMRKVQAITGGTSEDMERMEDLARELGRTTAHSASAAAEGMSYLGLAGWDTNEILEATPDMLNLASAAQMDLARAADIVSDTMSIFNIDAEKADNATDIFAATASNANTNVEMLGDAMSYAGPAASNAGMSLEDTNAILGVLADNGIKGSKSGTILNAMLSNMRDSAEDGEVALGDTAVAIYDAEGEMRDFGDIMRDMEDATADMTGEQRDQALASVFQERAMRGVSTLLDGNIGSVEELSNKLHDSEGASKDMAETMEDGLGGALREMRSQMEGFLLDLGEELEPYARRGAELIGNLASRFGELDESTRRNIVVFGGLAAAIGPLLIAIGMFLKLTATAISGFRTLITVVRGLAKAKFLLSKAFWLSPIGMITAAVLALIAAGVLLWRNWDVVTEKAMTLWDNLTTAFSNIRDGIVGAFASARDRVFDIFAGMRDGVVGFINKIISALNGMIGGINDIGFDVPDWVPGLGGKDFSLSVPTIPEVDGSHYHGLDRVPRDGYTARLHEGEAVLPRQEAESYRQGGGGVTVNVSGNEFVVRQESDIDKIADALAQKINVAYEGGA